MQGSILPVMRPRVIFDGQGTHPLRGARVRTAILSRVAPNTGNEASAGMPIYGLGEDVATQSSGWGSALTQGVMSLVGAGANILAAKDDAKAAQRDIANARAEADASAARSADAQRASAQQEATLLKLAESQKSSGSSPWLIIGGLAAAAAVVGFLVLRKPKGKR
jgi:hypothetical protein